MRHSSTLTVRQQAYCQALEVCKSLLLTNGDSPIKPDYTVALEDATGLEIKVYSGLLAAFCGFCH